MIKEYILGNEVEFSNISGGHFLAVEVTNFEKVYSIKISGSRFNSETLIIEEHTEYISVDSKGLYLSGNVWVSVLEVEKKESDTLRLIGKNLQSPNKYDLSIKTGTGLKSFTFVIKKYKWLYTNKFEEIIIESLTCKNNEIIDSVEKGRNYVGNTLQDNSVFLYSYKLDIDLGQNDFIVAYTERENINSYKITF